MVNDLYSEIPIYLSQFSKGCQARDIISLQDGWRFSPGEIPQAYETDFDDSSWRVLPIPHDFSIEAGFSEKNYANAYVQSGVLWYRKHFTISAAKSCNKVYLLFDGVCMNSGVWINDRFLGNHPYAFTPFWYDITPFVHFGEDTENVIAVKADNSLQPFSRSYTGAGIFRNVWLISAYPLHIEPWGVTAVTQAAGKEQAQIMVHTAIRVDRYPETVWNAFSWQGEGTAHNNEIKKSCVLHTSIIDRDGNRISEAKDTCVMPSFCKNEFHQLMNVPSPKLWSPDEPNLYSIYSAIMIGDKVVDDVITPLGIRTIAYDTGKGLQINGQSIKLKGVCLHQDSGIFGSAVPVKAWIKKLQILKEMGCNAIRTAHHPFQTEFYSICDFMGLLVMDEAFDEWRMGWDRGYVNQSYGKNTYGYYLYFKQWHEEDLRAMLRRDRNHPSIIMWSTGNEIPELYFAEGKELLEELVRIVKQEDKSRPVTVCAEGNHLLRLHEGIMDLVDIKGYNYVQSREGEAYYENIHKEHPQWVLLGSETSFEPLHWEKVLSNTYVTGQFLWSGYDYLGEGSDLFGEDAGLGVTFDTAALAANKGNAGNRAIRHGWAYGIVDILNRPRGEYFYRKSIWTEQPMIHMAVKTIINKSQEAYQYYKSESHWNWEAGSKKTIFCFTNCEEVELILNGKSLGKRETAALFPYALEWDIDYMPGTLTAIGYRKGTEVCRNMLVTAGSARKLEAKSDSVSLKAACNDFAAVDIHITDAYGTIVPDATQMVKVTVKGCGILLGVYSADMTSNASYRSDRCKAYHGHCQAIIQASGETGFIDASFECEGMDPVSIMIRVE